ncbi:unnamed protein product [Hymenolepis diminuta]|uniref:Peptidase A2 domain-containing protein n=1 Tax=Hymenolepis diminuta TaxID=6216 RepID=A0A564Z951_HYMDI|nr:unnamed protein product [Hymenolepis diminuta]
MIETNETRTYQIRKPEINRSPENNPTSQPQTQHTFPTTLINNKPRCRFCGDFHFFTDCPFYERQCQNCNSYGHREGFCQSSQLPYTGHRRGHYQNQHCHGILATMQVDIHIQLQVDTGSDITIVSNEMWKTLGSQKLYTVPFKVSITSSDAVQLSGVMKCKTTFKRKTATTLCYMANRDINLIGLDWIDMFKYK